MALQIAKGLCGRNFSKQINILQNIPKITNVNARCVVMRTEKAQPAPLESHDERNMRLNRPQSPHLTIYQPQLTSFLSITHRMTGIALTGYAVVLGLGALVMPHDFAHYATMIEGTIYFYLLIYISLVKKVCLGVYKIILFSVIVYSG